MVAKFQQPDYNTQSGTGYPLTIDAAIAVLAELAAQFAVSAQDTPNMTVRMRGGKIAGYGANTVIGSIAAQDSGTITAPTTNPRNDIVYLNWDTGLIGVQQGTEAVTPTDPLLPVRVWPLARIRLQTSTTAITNSIIDDLRITTAPVDAIFNVANTWLQAQTFNDYATFANGKGIRSSRGARIETGGGGKTFGAHAGADDGTGLAVVGFSSSQIGDLLQLFKSAGDLKLAVSADGVMTAGTVPLARMGSVVLNTSSSVPANTEISAILEAASAGHKFWQYSVYTDGAEIHYGSYVTTTETVQASQHTFIRRQQAGSELLVLINGTASARTINRKAYKLTET